MYPIYVSSHSNINLSLLLSAVIAENLRLLLSCGLFLYD